MKPNSFSLGFTASTGSQFFDLNKAIEEAAKNFPNETSEFIKKTLNDSESKRDSN